MEKIEGIVRHVIHRNGSGFIIFAMIMGHAEVSVTGNDCDIHEADVVECIGEWTTYNGQPQFKAKSIIPQIPSSASAILSYLAAGRIKGISQELAGRLVDKFGIKTLEVIEKNPRLLSQVKGFGAKRIKAITDGVRDQIGFRSIYIFLHGFGLGKRHINKIYEQYGLTAVEVIKENPYQLCVDIDGIGFPIADRIALKSGIAKDDPKRVIAGIAYALNAAIHLNGDTGVTKPILERESIKLLGREGQVSSSVIIDGIEQVISSSLAQEVVIDGSPIIFPISMYNCEKSIARSVAKVLHNFKPMTTEGIDVLIDASQKRLGVTFDSIQRDAVKKSISSGISVVTGGPGTGKTTITRALIDCLVNGFGYCENEILLCAPTGKAAKRIAQTSGLEAMTMHRALNYSFEEDEFGFDEVNPLKARVIVIDESSMADTILFSLFIRAVANGAQVILLGDVDQLPSVGPGRVLRDMIDSGCIPVTRLVKIYRQDPDSHITQNAHLVNSGKMPEIENKKSKDFWFVRTQSDEALAQEVVSLVKRMSSHFKLDMFEDIQVLTPMRRGVVGRIELNNRLQAALNANAAPGIKLKQDDVDVEFKIGDKVMHIKNNRTLQVFNGDTGRVKMVNVKERTLSVDYEGVLVEYAFLDLEQLRLSYTMTIHKSQGSEYPCIIMVASNSHYTMLGRKLFYTGMTRAKKYCTIVGETRALQVAVSREMSDSRMTGLIHHLKNEMGEVR